MSKSTTCVRLIVPVLVGMLAAPLVRAGNEPLFQGVHFPAPQGCAAVATGDLDGDGDADIVAGGSGASRVLLNQGGREFLADKSWPGGATDVALADLDGDADLDLVVTDDADEQVLVRLGNGGGVFGPAAIYTTSASPDRIEVADLDADGNADLVVGLNSIRVAILLGNGDGTFSAAPEVGPAGFGEKGVAVADLDGDGVLDLAVTAQLGQVSLFRGNGDGTFVPTAGLGGLFVPMDVAAGDMDGDGDTDLVVVDQSLPTDRLFVYSNAGSGAFPGAPFFELLPGLPSRIELADLDEDGALDVLVSTQGTGHRVATFLGQGDGTLLAGAGVAAMQPAGIEAADLDNDGDLDLVVAESFLGAVELGWGEGDGSFRRGAATSDATQEPAAADLDGDADLDLVTATDVGIVTALNTGNGHLAQATTSPSSDFEIGITTGDFDGDGKADVLSSNWSITLGPGGKFWKGNGAGGLAPPVPLAVSPRLNDVHAADLDLDGDLDAVFASAEGSPSPGAGFLHVVLGHGDGTFDAAFTVPLNGKPSASIAMGDFNADGVPDVLATGLVHAVQMVLIGRGDGTFDPPVETVPFIVAHDVVAGDFNGDGFDDAAFTQPNTFVAWSLGVRFGNGDGTLGPVTTYGNAGSYGHLDAADVDNDGYVDAVNVQPGLLQVFLNQGDGSLLFEQDVDTALADTHVLLADMDGDGWVDAVQTKGGDFGAELSVLINQRGPWNDLKSALAGTAGLPRQIGEGTLVANEAFRFTLRDARPNTNAFHIVGLGTLFAPLKGGVLVPALDFINSLPVTDADGEVVLEGHWLTGLPAGFELFFQFWLADPASVKGFAASNAIRATMP